MINTFGCFWAGFDSTFAPFTCTGTGWVLPSFDKAMKRGTIGSMICKVQMCLISNKICAWNYLAKCKLFLFKLFTFLLKAQILSHSIMFTDLDDPWGKIRKKVFIFNNIMAFNCHIVSTAINFCNIRFWKQSTWAFLSKEINRVLVIDIWTCTFISLEELKSTYLGNNELF